MRKAEKRSDGESSFPLSPMVDIVFLLLIFFALQPFRTPQTKKLDCELPVVKPNMKRPPAKVEIALSTYPDDSAHCLIYMDGALVGDSRQEGMARLRKALVERAGREGPLRIHLAPETDVRFVRVLAVYDLCQTIGLHRVLWKTTPERP